MSWDLKTLRKLRQTQELSLLENGAKGIFGLILILAALFSVPAGIYTAIMTDSLFHGLASFCVPFYGIVYTIVHYLF